jgi:hypothetical protein
MFDKEIEFSAHEDYFALKEDYPIPSKLNIPEWYKNLEHTVLDKTVKGCMPFLDSLTAGYILKMPQDFYIRHNVDNENEKKEKFKDSFQTFGLYDQQQILYAKNINLNSGFDNHPVKQVEGAPFIEKNKNLPFYKILNPWKITTPKGYSCLFVPPSNNSDDRFSIIPAIVDTDVFPNEINFPIIINGDKYPVLETILKKGTPYVQIIPFKRDNWKMKFKLRKQKEIQNSRIFYGLNLLNIYKNKYWNKKTWK